MGGAYSTHEKRLQPFKYYLGELWLQNIKQPPAEFENFKLLVTIKT
jgi:hypothetical protein